MVVSLLSYSELLWEIIFVSNFLLDPINVKRIFLLYKDYDIHVIDNKLREESNNNEIFILTLG